MNNSPKNTRRLILGLAGLSDMALGIFFVLVALRILPIFENIPSWIFYLIGGGLFTTGTFMAIFSLTPKDSTGKDEQ
ncbi:MAG: hypothetical protein HN390_05610 [Anaerolineae bacterium]|jgi:hypothetical protein|nr:hypothetical protein [Anaerolineae bacterium]MBT7190175.1 hypothetical protein [Anaerolineae bacterium]MBT7990444.1 hypothetical protein [Anaerolineae bacterium]